MSEEEKDTTNSDESSSVFGKVREKFQDGILDLSEEFDELTMVVRKDSIYDILEFLKTDTEHSYDFLVDVTAVDYSQMEDVLTKYEVLRDSWWSITSTRTNRATHAVYKTQCMKKELSILLLCRQLEREAWNGRGSGMTCYGLVCKPPELRRILMPDDFELYCR